MLLLCIGRCSCISGVYLWLVGGVCITEVSTKLISRCAERAPTDESAPQQNSLEKVLISHYVSWYMVSPVNYSTLLLGLQGDTQKN